MAEIKKGQIGGRRGEGGNVAIKKAESGILKVAATRLNCENFCNIDKIFSIEIEQRDHKKGVAGENPEIVFYVIQNFSPSYI